MDNEINWLQEANRIGEIKDYQKKEWFKPKPGKNKIKLLSEGQAFTTEWEGKELHKVRFDIEFEGKEFSWGITKGSSYKSLYGQLALIAQNNKGKLTGQEITLLTIGKGRDTNYTILEAVDLIPTEIPEEVVE